MAKTTIKQTTYLENYNGIIKGDQVGLDQNAALNMCIDDKREILTYNRPANGQFDGTYLLNSNGYELKEDSKKTNRINYSKRTTLVPYDSIQKIYTRNKKKLIENEDTRIFDDAKKKDNSFNRVCTFLF